MAWPPTSSADGHVPFAEDPWRALQFIILPVATLVLIEVGVLTRTARAATVDVLRLDYVAHARAKGLSELAVLARHVLPNAFAQVGSPASRSR